VYPFATISSHDSFSVASLADHLAPVGLIHVCSPLPHVSRVHPSKSGLLAGVVEQSPSPIYVAYATGNIVCCYCVAAAIALRTVKRPITNAIAIICCFCINLFARIYLL
jgi:hypothetical protein